MKKLFFGLLCLLSLSVLHAQKTKVNPGPSQELILKMLKNSKPNATFTKGNTPSTTSSERKVYAEYAYCDCNTGEWGTATVWVHSFLGITYGAVQTTYTVLGTGCTCATVRVAKK